MSERSFWETELYNRSYDLIVVGAGLTGQSAAYFFKKENPGAKVLVVDRGFFPLGASTRNAGFACFGSVTEHMADIELESEEKIINRIGRRIKGLNLLRETLGDENIEYQEPGSFEIFRKQENFDQAADFLAICNRWLEEAAGLKNVYSVENFLHYPAIKIQHEGCLHPGKMMSTLYDLNLKSGVEFRWNSPVEHLDADEASVNIHNGVKLKAENLLVATNAFTSSLLKDIVINPGRGFVFITKRIDNLQWKGTFHFDRGYYYFRNVGDRLLLGGARSLNIDVETTVEFGVNTLIRDHLKNFANEVLKLPQDWEIEQEWSGIMGFTANKSPILQRTGNRGMVAAGLSGMGVALGMQLGKEAAGGILE